MYQYIEGRGNNALVPHSELEVTCAIFSILPWRISQNVVSHNGLFCGQGVNRGRSETIWPSSFFVGNFTTAMVIVDDRQPLGSALGPFWGLYQHPFVNTVSPLFNTPTYWMRRVKAKHRFDLACTFLERLLFVKRICSSNAFWTM